MDGESLRHLVELLDEEPGRKLFGPRVLGNECRSCEKKSACKLPEDVDRNTNASATTDELRELFVKAADQGCIIAKKFKDLRPPLEKDQGQNPQAGTK